MSSALSADALLPAFAGALLGPPGACPPGLRAWNGCDPAARFAVHRNNVVVSLVAALADTFPVLQQIVGGEFFAAMARTFVVQQPPRSPVLAQYGAGLPAFIAGFAPATSLPYLADLARLEWLRLQALHAADLPGLSAEHIATRLARPEHLAQARLALHPSLAVLVSPFAVISLWAAHQVQGDPAEVDLRQPEQAIVLRADDEVLVLPAPAPAAAFTAALGQGSALLAAADRAQAAASPASPFDLAASLGLLIRHGAITAWHNPAEDPP